MSVAAVAAQVERMLGIRPCGVAPIVGGADASSRLARADLPVGAAYPSVVYKAYDDALKYQREARSLAFVNRLGDFAPRVLARDDNELSLVMELIPGATLYDLDRADAERAPLVAVKMLAQFHCVAAQHLPAFGEAQGGKPPQWEPPGAAELVAAWVRAVRAAASTSDVPVPEGKLELVSSVLAQAACADPTVVLCDVNPFNFLFACDSVRFVDLATCQVGPAWIDLDLTRRVGYSEAQIAEAHRAYLNHRRAIGNPIGNETHFLTAADYWEVASALLAAQGFQAVLEGEYDLKPSVPEHLRRHARFRDDVLADVWAICNRRPELRAIAEVMNQVLSPDICQERYLRSLL
jgi:hypothetical protein